AREAERDSHSDRDRHIHIDVPRAQSPEGTPKERLAGISRRRQRNQSRQPVKQVARLLRHVGDVAGPDDTESSMTFIAAKPATARHFISRFAWALSSASARFGANGWA